MNHDYDVALSFAGEDRRYVEKVADLLVKSGVQVFYDEHEKANLWGKDLFDHLHEVYSESARYTVLFISRAAMRKPWVRHERQAAQDRALREEAEYILPVRFDDSVVPGLPKTRGYVDLRSTSPRELVALIRKKLGAADTRTTVAAKLPTQRARTKIDLLEDMIDFARSTDGLDLSGEDAQSWADELLRELDYDVADFAVYQKSFHFAVDELEMSYEESDEHARGIVDSYDSAAFDFFLKVFRWAYDNFELPMHANEVERFAVDFINKFEPSDLPMFKKAYKIATDRLELEESEAIAYALDHLEN